MTASAYPVGSSRVVAGRYPPPGTNEIADVIRERRGERGITPLDANLLHVPPIAAGYNNLLGAIRTKGKLPGDIREAMILRIAAINSAAFEWIHHVELGRKEGLSNGQLYIIRDITTPLPPLEGILSPLQLAAIQFTDHSTRNAQVPTAIIDKFKAEIRFLAVSSNAEQAEQLTDDLYVEAAMVVASYNMVSRFLLSTDVAGISDLQVPWPVERNEHFVTLPSFPPVTKPTHTIHAITLVTLPSAPWLVFANSLLTDWSMWSYIVPYFLDLLSTTGTSPKLTYNILLHSQRGHGQSTLPITEGQERLTTIPLLATDISQLLDQLSITTPVHSVIGVSQGGAVALAFANLYGEKARSVVVCDTAASTPAGNKEAWEERIRLACGSSAVDVGEYARNLGMKKLASVTVPRWFPPGSSCHPGSSPSEEKKARSAWVDQMVSQTDVNGFMHGARALGDYDVLKLEPPEGGRASSLFETRAEKVLLLAGKLDGGGKVGLGMQGLRTRWKEAKDMPVSYAEIDESGHLPMIDSPLRFSEVVSGFISSL